MIVSGMVNQTGVVISKPSLSSSVPYCRFHLYSSSLRLQSVLYGDAFFLELIMRRLYSTTIFHMSRSDRCVEIWLHKLTSHFDGLTTKSILFSDLLTTNIDYFLINHLRCWVNYETCQQKLNEISFPKQPFYIINV